MVGRGLLEAMAIDADIVIAGAGAAGLMLAGALVGPGRRVSVLVLEPRQIIPNPRRWVFAAAPGHALSRHVAQAFDTVTLAGRTRRLDRLRVQHVPAASVQHERLERLAAAPEAQVEQGVRIDSVNADTRGALIETSLGMVRSRVFVDTRPIPGGGVAGRSWTLIAWIALTPPGCVDAPPGFSLSAGFPESGGVGLDQHLVLPDGSALLEAVRLAAPGDEGAGLEARLEDRLAALAGCGVVAQRRRFVAPLLPGAPNLLRGPVLFARAGIGGICFGPGMEALRLAGWAEAAARRFAETGRMPPPPGPSSAARLVAARLASRLRAGPDAGADWLNDQINRLDPDAALRVLAGTPGWREGLGLAPARIPA